MPEISDRLQKIQNLIEQNRHDEALEQIEPFLKTPPQKAADLFWCGQLAYLLDIKKPAAWLLSEAVRLEPDAPNYCSMYGFVLSELNQFKLAQTMLNKAIDLNPGSPLCHHHMGRHYYNTGQFALAKASLEKTLALKEDSIDSLLYLAYILIQQSHWDEASQRIDLLLSLEPNHPKGHILKSQLEYRSHQTESARKRLEHLLELYPDYDAGWFEYGAFLQKIGQYSEAQTAFIKANQLARHEEINTESFLEKHTKALSQTLHGYTDISASVLPLSFEPDLCNTPVLIVGFPRSGTTLLSSMLDQHPRLHSAGELSILPDLRTFAEQELKTPFDISAVNLSLWHNEHLELAELLSQSYVALQAQYRESQSISPEVRIIDKGTANVQNLPLVARIAPQTQVINIIRDGREASWSCFTQNFSRYIYYSYHYLDAIQAWQQEIDMARRYAQAFNMNYYELHYEHLVHSPEQELRRLLNFLNLDWDERCLQFQNTAQPVQTASYEQVKKPLYTTSLSKASHYPGPYQEMTEAARDMLKELGYLE